MRFTWKRNGSADGKYKIGGSILRRDGKRITLTEVSNCYKILLVAVLRVWWWGAVHNLFIRKSKSLHSSLSINTIVFQVMRNITDKKKTEKVTALWNRFTYNIR